MVLWFDGAVVLSCEGNRGGCITLAAPFLALCPRRALGPSSEGAGSASRLALRVACLVGASPPAGLTRSRRAGNLRRVTMRRPDTVGRHTNLGCPHALRSVRLPLRRCRTLGANPTAHYDAPARNLRTGYSSHIRSWGVFGSRP